MNASRSRIAFALAALVASTAAALIWSAGNDRERPRSALEVELGREHLLLSAGADAGDRALWLVSSGVARRLSSEVLLSAITADDKDLIVSGAGAGGSGGDELFTLQGGHFVAAGAGGPEEGEHSPKLGPDRQVAYMISTPEGAWSLRLWNIEDSEDRAFRVSKTKLGDPAWGSSGALAFFEPHPVDGGSVVRLDRDLKIVARHRLKGARAGAVHWGGGPFLALGRGSVADGVVTISTTVLDPNDGRVISEIAEWKPMSWAPDGRRLLLLRDGKIGIARAPTFAAVEELDHPGPRYVSSGTWVPVLPASLKSLYPGAASER